MSKFDLTTSRVVDPDSGQIVPDVVFEQFVASYSAPNPYRSLFPPPPRLNRRQRWTSRLYGYRWRVRTAIDVLRNRHDCGDL